MATTFDISNSEVCISRLTRREREIEPFALAVDFVLREGDVLMVQLHADRGRHQAQVLVRCPLHKDVRRQTGRA